MDLRANGDYFPIQQKPIGFYDRYGVCLLRGTDWVFIYNSGLNKNLRSAHTAVFMCVVWI